MGNVDLGNINRRLLDSLMGYNSDVPGFDEFILSPEGDNYYAVVDLMMLLSECNGALSRPTAIILSNLEVHLDILRRERSWDEVHACFEFSPLIQININQAFADVNRKLNTIRGSLYNDSSFVHNPTCKKPPLALFMCSLLGIHRRSFRDIDDI